jgi:3',5'-cyclic AMP phosphodiesterase CpdA
MDRGGMDLQYRNWKRAIEPFAHYFPVYVSMGNHEALMRVFGGNNNRIMLDRFPYETESAEAAFAAHFVNPLNGPNGEDGAKYDPNPANIDFPSYKENVYYYTYDNVAVVVLNSDYWYAPSTGLIPKTGGGLHGYIMDNQIKWFRKTVKALEKNKTIDHIFVTQHTPMFPNGGHVGDDMWYNGQNSKRPYVNGKPLDKGIIERRDELLQIAVNESTKVIGVLTGDEHNYCRTEIGPETVIYPDNWDMDKLALSRTIYQINNGAAGAPYYAQDQTPWTPFTSNFTTQNALVFFHVDGEKIRMEVMNPDTLEVIEEFDLR